METKVNYAAVGIFVLVLGAVLIGVVLWLASGGGFQKKYDPYLAIFDESVSGLNFNAPVKYRGVDVGKVKEVTLDAANPELVRIVFAIERGVPIKEDTVATLKTQGLTGIAYVELSGGTRASPSLTAAKHGTYPEIRTKASLSARLENLLTTLMAKLDSTSSSINSLLGAENQAAFKSALADFATVAHTIAGRKDSIDKGLVNAAQVFENGPPNGG